MYIIHDRVTPHIQEFTHALRIKNLVLRYWPTRLVDGIEVMGVLFIYVKGQGVIETESTARMLKLINIDIDELKEENWEGVENYYIYWQRFADSYELLPEDIKNYIEIHSTLSGGVSEWETAKVTYKPIRPLDAYATDAEVIQYLETADSDAISFATEYYDGVGEEQIPENRLLAIALLDSDSVLFEKVYTISSKKIVSRTSSQLVVGYTYDQFDSVQSGNVLEVGIEVKYRRKALVDLLVPEIEALLNLVVTRLGTVNDAPTMYTKLDYQHSSVRPSLEEAAVASEENSINATLKTMFLDTVPGVSDNLVHMSGDKYYVKKDGILPMKVRDFAEFFGKSLKTGYTEEKAEWWEKLLAIVLAIIIIAIAIFSGGAALAPGMSVMSSVFAFSSAFALVLSLGTLALGALSAAVGYVGRIGFAAILNKVINILGVISTIAGIISIYSAWQIALAKQVAAEGIAKGVLEEAGQEITSEAIQDVIISDNIIGTLADVAIQDVSLSQVSLSSVYQTTKAMVFGGIKHSMMDILNKTVSAINWAASYFMEKDMAQIQGDLTAQEEKADELKQSYELYKGSVDKVFYNTSDMYDGYYNPYFNDFELSTGEGSDRYYKTATHWRVQNSLEWVYPN